MEIRYELNANASYVEKDDMRTKDTYPLSP